MSPLFLRSLLFFLLVRGNFGEECMVRQEHLLQSESWVGSAVPVGMGVVPDHDVAEMVQAVRMYFGDHVDWDELHQLNMPEMYDTKDIGQESIKIANEIQEDIEHHSTPPVEEFSFHEMFRAPLNAQNMWNREIALASPYIMVPLDQINIFMNGGNLSVDSSEYRYRGAGDTLEFLRILSEIEQNLDQTFYQTLPTMLIYQRGTIVFYLDMISSQASCLYDILEARDSSMSRVFIKNVEKEKFVLFVAEFVETLKKLVMSEKTVGMIQMFYKTMKSKVKSCDYDTLSVEMYSTFIKMRNLLLKVDIDGLFENVNEIHFAIAESVWKLKTGQWPELAKFVDNFFRKTYGSREFWVRLDEYYHESVEAMRRTYIERQKEFENLLTDEIIPFFQSLKLMLNRISQGDKELIDNIFDYIDFDVIELNNYVRNMIDRNFLSCWTRLHGMSDYDEMKNEVMACPDVQYLNTLIFSNWPPAEVFPPSFEEFAQKLHRTFWLAMSSVFGSCQ